MTADESLDMCYYEMISAVNGNIGTLKNRRMDYLRVKKMWSKIPRLFINMTL